MKFHEAPITRTMNGRKASVVLVALLLVVLFALQLAITPMTYAVTGPNNVVTGLTSWSATSLDDQKKLLYDSTSGLWWVFYSDSSVMQCTTSSDGGVTWASPTQINATVVSGSRFGVWYDTKNSMFYYVATNFGTSFHYRYGKLSASGCGAIGWSIDTTAVDGTYNNLNTPTISAVDTSTIWISVTESAGKNYFIEAFLCNTITCSSKHLVTSANPSYKSIILCMSSGLAESSEAGLLYAADASTGGSAIKFDYTINGGSNWNSSAFTTSNIYQGDKMSAYNVGTTAYVAAIENSPASIFFFKYTLDGPDPVEALLVSGPDRNVGIESDNGTNFAVAYTDSTSISFVSSTNSGATWGSPNTLFTGEATIQQTTLNVNRGPSNLLGMIWSGGTNPYSIRFGTFSPVIAITTTSTSTTSTSTTSTSSSTTTQVTTINAAPSLADLLSSLNLLSSFVAFPISYYSFKFNRLLGSTALRVISIGFAILGTGLLTEGLTGFIADATIVDGLLARKLVADAGLVFLILQLVAYLSFAWGYGIEVFGKAKPEASGLSAPDSVLPVGILLSTFGAWYDFALFVYLLMVVLLAFTVFEAILVYGKSRRRSALLVLLSFGLILASHVLMLVSVAALTPVIFYEGTIAQFFGFVLLLWFLVRSGRFGPT